MHQQNREAYAPVVLFVYNRLEHTKQTIDALLRNDLASKSELYIFSDAPKDEKTVDSVNKVRNYVQTISGFEKICIVNREVNYGLAKSIIEGVTEICMEHDRVIVLEDDLVTSPYFLQYMNRALEIYENEGSVVSIHGYLFPVKNHFPETFFIKGAHCWGWATWKRGWEIFEQDGRKLLNELRQRGLEKEFDYNGSAEYIEMLKGQIAGKNDSWAVRWYASAFLANKLTLYPCISLVKNIGLDSTGVHSSTTNNYDTEIATRPIAVGNIPIIHNISAYKEIETFFRGLKQPLLKRICRRISAFFS
jgi:hypothetical protein